MLAINFNLEISNSNIYFRSDHSSCIAKPNKILDSRTTNRPANNTNF